MMVLTSLLIIFLFIIISNNKEYANIFMKLLNNFFTLFIIGTGIFCTIILVMDIWEKIIT